MAKNFIPYSNSVVLKNRFNITKNLTNKNYTQVYEAEDTHTKQKIIVKREHYNRKLHINGISLLQNEHYVLEKLNSMYDTGFPVVLLAKYEKHDKNQNKKGNFNLLMTYVGIDLKSLYNTQQTKFTFDFIREIGDQLIDRIEKLHRVGFIHGDLKPENICIGKVYDRHTGKYEKNDIVHLIDFELCTPFIDPETSLHIKSEQKSFTGNLKFGSIASCFGMNKSRRDDMESIAYILIYFYFGYLPWDKMKSKYISSCTLDEYKMYGTKKRKSLTNEYFQSLPDCLFLILKESIQMSFTGVPNYKRFRDLLRMQ